MYKAALVVPIANAFVSHPVGSLYALCVGVGYILGSPQGCMFAVC